MQWFVFHLLVPRLLFDQWSYNDYHIIFSNEQALSALVDTVVSFVKVHGSAWLTVNFKRVSQSCPEHWSTVLSFSGGPHVPVNMADSMENAGSWTVSGSKEAMEVPKNFKDLWKHGIQNIAQYSGTNMSRMPFPTFFPTYIHFFHTFCQHVARQRSYSPTQKVCNDG